MGQSSSRNNTPSTKPSQNPSYNSSDDVILNEKQLEHPLFLQDNDKLLSIFIESLNCVMKPNQDTLGLQKNYNDFDQYLRDTLKDDRGEAELIKDIKKLNSSSNTMCGRVVKMNEVYFRCLDCEVGDEQSSSLQCQECFDRADHKGHRIVKNKPMSEGLCTCDCGAIEYLKQEAFCPRHLYKEQTLQEALEDFPKQIQRQFVQAYKKAMYGIICLIEISQKAGNRKTKLIINALAQSLFEKILTFYKFCVSKWSKTFSLLLEVLFQENFEAEYNRVWHNCQDLREEHDNWNQDIPVSHPCTCSVLGCSFRFARHFKQDTQVVLTQMLIECSKESRFKSFIALEIHRYAYFLFANPTSKDEDFERTNTKLTDMYLKDFLLKEEDVEHFQYVLGVIWKSVSSYSELDPKLVELLLQIACDATCIFGKESKASHKILQETNFIQETLESVAAFQKKFLYPDEIKLGLFEHNINNLSIDQSMTAEKFINMIMENSFLQLEKVPAEEKKPFFKKIVAIWNRHFQDIRSVNDHQRLYSRKSNFNVGLERVLCIWLLNYLREITLPGLQNFFSEFLSDTYPAVLASLAIRGPLNIMGTMRFIDVLKNMDQGVFKSYYHLQLGMFEMDAIFIQMMILLIRPTDIFDLIIRNFLPYSVELQEFCLSFAQFQSILVHPNLRQILLILEDLLHFFIFIMTDELSIANLYLREQAEKKGPEFPPERIKKKLIINSLITHHSVDVSQFKIFLQSLFIEDQKNPLDPTIAQLTVPDDSRRINLKEEYEGEFDPYIFYKTYGLMRDLRNKLTASNVHSKAKEDLISGKFYTDLPQYLVDIQHNLFQSRIPEFVCHILGQCGQETAILLPPVLRLVLLNLQVMDEALKKESVHIEGLKKKVEENYLTVSFSQKLENIVRQGDNKECEPCIKNIQKLIKALLVQFHKESDIIEEIKPIITVEDRAEINKNKAKEKMARLKEEFARKQAKFADKNEILLSQSPGVKDSIHEDETSTHKEDLICQYCLEKIQETDDYGIPVYITFTNNFYNTEKEVVFEEQDYTDLPKISWWPVVSSCNHFYHQKCFDTNFENCRGPQNQLSQFFSNEYESHCTLCKTLCNNFLCINKENSAAPEESKGDNSVNQSNKFVLKAQNLLDSLAEKLVTFDSQPKPLASVSVEEIFKRSYGYFIESFYLHQRPYTLEKSFKLYVNFFRAYRSFMKSQHKKLPENISFYRTLDKKTDTPQDQLSSLTPELLVQDTCFEILEAVSTSEEVALNKYLNTIKVYLALNAAKLAMMEKDSSLKLQDAKASFEENHDMRDKLIKQLVFPVQKIILAYFLNTCVASDNDNNNNLSDFCRLLCEFKGDLETLDLLLQKAKLANSFEELLTSSLVELEAKPAEEQSKLDAILSFKFFNGEKLPVTKFAPAMIEFPNNYAEYNDKYIRQKCDLCNKNNSDLFDTMCLICGKIICPASCEKSTNKKGNISRHANKYHMGLGIMYGFIRSELILTNNPLCLVYNINGLYCDQLGQNIQVILARDIPKPPRILEFKKFNLNEDTLKMMKELVNNHNIARDIFEKIPANPRGLLVGNFI